MRYSLLAVIVCLAAHGQAQWFGGYADGVGSLATGVNTFGPAHRMVYDNFTFDLPGNIIQFRMIGLNNTIGPVGMRWEIRTGVSAGNGGNLVVSGYALTGTSGDLPGVGYGTPPPGPGRYQYFDSGPSVPIALGAGSYWLGLAPIQQGGSWDVTTTQGLGSIGHPINDGNAFYYDSSNPSLNFVSMGSLDYGLQIFTDGNTNLPVPEPATAVLCCAALGAAARRTRRFRRD